MGININLDYTTLFSSLSSSSNYSYPSVNLGDYASIKNGSYYQIAKAYYAKSDSSKLSNENNSKNTNAVTKASTSNTALATVKSDADSLKDSADALIKTGKDSLFNKKNITTTNADGTTSTSYGYDMNAIYKGVKSFVDDYNSLVVSGGRSSNSNIANLTSNMERNTDAYANLLSKVGIRVGSDHKLSIDESTFKSSDATSIKSLFNGNSSLSYSTSAKASQIYYSVSSANNTYNFTGGLINSNSSGSLYNSYI